MVRMLENFVAQISKASVKIIHAHELAITFKTKLNYDNIHDICKELVKMQIIATSMGEPLTSKEMAADFIANNEHIEHLGIHQIKHISAIVNLQLVSSEQFLGYIDRLSDSNLQRYINNIVKDIIAAAPSYQEISWIISIVGNSPLGKCLWHVVYCEALWRSDPAESQFMEILNRPPKNNFTEETLWWAELEKSIEWDMYLKKYKDNSIERISRLVGYEE